MRRIFFILTAIACCTIVNAQELADSIAVFTTDKVDTLIADSIGTRVPMHRFVRDSTTFATFKNAEPVDSTALKKQMRKMEKEMAAANWRPDPQKSLWLAFAFPGLGQIYNRKYWKLPIVYGIGCGIGYAIAYTNRMYRDYMTGYQNINSAHPDKSKYESLIPEGYPESSYSDYLKNEMNNYRRSRDISIVAGVVAYALTIIDAFVDAQLNDFDVSPNLSMKVKPTVQDNGVGCGVKVSF